MKEENSMRIGIIVTFVSNFGEKGFYNSQEIGLAKALSNDCDEVVIYKATTLNDEKEDKQIEGYNNVRYIKLPSRHLGNNGFIDLEQLDKKLDSVVYFSDTQLFFPRLYRWSVKNSVKMIPYIGVTESHSSNIIIQNIINLLCKRNIKIYKCLTCLVKTPEVKKVLVDLGVQNIVVTPVGLDLELMNQDYSSVDRDYLKAKYGYKLTDKIILFIGRLTPEKQPLEMIEIFKNIYKIDKSYKLLVVGKGELKDALDNSIMESKLKDYIRVIERIPNSDIWELYRVAECFVNLNKQEIFGMSILEAMYYECKVVALKAPGPDFIIKDDELGCVVDSVENIEQIITGNKIDKLEAHNRVSKEFIWAAMVKIILDLNKITKR